MGERTENRETHRDRERQREVLVGMESPQHSCRTPKPISRVLAISFLTTLCLLDSLPVSWLFAYGLLSYTIYSFH